MDFLMEKGGQALEGAGVAVPGGGTRWQRHGFNDPGRFFLEFGILQPSRHASFFSMMSLNIFPAPWTPWYRSCSVAVSSVCSIQPKLIPGFAEGFCSHKLLSVNSCFSLCCYKWKLGLCPTIKSWNRSPEWAGTHGDHPSPTLHLFVVLEDIQSWESSGGVLFSQISEVEAFWQKSFP